MPETPDFDREAAETVAYEGLPPLTPRARRSGDVIFTNVRSVYPGLSNLGYEELGENKQMKSVLVSNGSVTCVAAGSACLSSVLELAGRPEEELAIVDLMGGSLTPGLTTFGSPLGLVEIRLESSTNDGTVYDSLSGDVPSFVGGDEAVIRAVDGLQLGGRNAL